MRRSKAKSANTNVFIFLCEEDGDEYGSHGGPEAEQFNHVPDAGCAGIGAVGRGAIW